MLLIVDVPDDTFEILNRKKSLTIDELIILNGTQLQKGMTNGEVIESLFPNVSTNFSNIIDMKLWWNAKYKETGEIHCNHTDTEIAKSFIEDVEAVKDLLPMAESENEE